MLDILMNIANTLSTIADVLINGFKALFAALESIFLLIPTVSEVAGVFMAENWFIGAGLLLGISFVLVRFLLDLL